MSVLLFRDLKRSPLLPLAIGAASVALVLGCQPTITPQPTRQATAAPTAAGSATRTVEFDAMDYSFTAPDTLPAGVTTIRLVNRGHEPHHGQLLRMNDGVTFDQFAGALQQEGEAALRFVSGEGGPGAVGPDGSSEVTLDLKPGSYALACFVASADGVPHLAKGMLKPIQVTPASAPATAPAIDARGTIVLKDFSFDMPDRLPAGSGLYKVVNQGPQLHEFNLWKLAPGASLDDALAWVSAPAGPPPFEADGGMNGLSADGMGYVTLDLKPGQYVAVCNVPDPGSGVPHVHLGMYKTFTVDG